MVADIEVEEKIVPLRKWNVNYVVAGHGPHVVLCMPGTLGTIWDNFRAQIEGFDKEKFTVVVWDPPGQGKSMPEMTFTENFYHEYADCAYEFMKKLGYQKFSLLGWCGGGRAGVILAGKYPDALRNLVLWGANTYFLPSEVEKFQKMKSLSNWADRVKDPLIAIYGEERLERYWGQWVDTLEKITAKGGDICTSYLDKITCPTFILYGQRDPLVDKAHAPFMHERIKNSKLYIDPGSHDFHRTNPEDFNKRVQEWLLQH